jgi:hypothetical protein
MVNRRKSLPVLLRSYESDFRTPDIPLIVRRVAWWSAKRSLKAAANLQLTAQLVRASQSSLSISLDE